MPEGIVRNNRAISQQLVEANSWRLCLGSKTALNSTIHQDNSEDWAYSCTQGYDLLQ